MELVTGILAKEHSGFDEFVSITETGKIAFYAEPLCLVIEVSLNGGMGIYFYRNLKDGGEQFRIVNVHVKMEIVLCLYGFLVWQNQGGDITSHDIQYTGRQGTIRIIAFYATLEKVGLDGQPFLVFAFSYGGYLQVVQEVLCFRSCEQ